MIHKYSMNGFNIVLDVNSGAVHVVDDAVYDVLDFYKEKTKEEIIKTLSQKYSESEIVEAIDEISQLEKDELLYTEDIY